MSIAYSQPTYSREVAPITNQKCARCHRPNDIAPFGLTNFDEVRAYAEDIKRVITERKMPPWKPVDGFGEFQDSFGLTPDERQTLLAWVDNGAAEGDPADLPPAEPASESPWHLGAPDLELTAPEYTPPDRSKDVYRCFVLPVEGDQSRYISAIQALPGNPQIVHHVLFYVDTTGESEELDAKDPEPGYGCFGGPKIALGVGSMIGAWAPGSRTRNLPEGIGLLLPPAARIVMQIHYYPGGRTESDQSRMGIWFSKPGSVAKRLVHLPVVNTRFEIPAGDEEHVVRASLPMIFSAQAIMVGPHMHLLGKKIKVEVVDLFTGRTRPLIYIDQWDFNWQNFYIFKEPVPLRAFSSVRVTATFDNSDHNPRNPNRPLRAVRWGENTEDEMCLAFIGIVFDNENLLQSN